MVRSENIEIPGFDSDASRIEYCCVRCIYAIPLCIIGGIVSYIMMLVIAILAFFNFFLILILGRRIESLYDLYVKVMGWQVQVGLYFNGSTDERPPLTPC
jgi:hypothetical protein